MTLTLRRPRSLAALVEEHGGRRTGESVAIEGLARLSDAGPGSLAPLTHPRYVQSAQDAVARGASLLVAAELAKDARVERLGGWVHPHATWTLAALLDECDAPVAPASVGEGSVVAPTATVYAGVTIGARVIIEAGCVIGRPGFGWATRDGVTRAVPQRGGVVIEDDVYLGPLCTVDAGTLGPTRIRRGAKLDAHCHVGHNVDVGEGAILAAQCGLAGSVEIGALTMLGGQVGVADHVRIGARARVAAKSGVIGDVPEGAVVAGYPALPRVRWLRGLAKLYRRNA